MPPVNAAAAMRSFFVNRGAGVFALSAFALGGNAGCAERYGAVAPASTIAVDRVLTFNLTIERIE
jgi:hypothetical protein